MASGRFRFDSFLLDCHSRRLSHGPKALELNSRYLDALILLVREQGQLVTKDRFMAEVWHGVPVTDEALTQCIKTLRKVLGDSAANPRFIETVPKHGYRFIAAVTADDAAPAPMPVTAGRRRGALPLLGAAGTIGGGVAGLVGGVFYGLAAALQPVQAGMGAVSVLLVLMALTILVALLGGAGVAFGIITAARLASGRPSAWSILGGAAGGFLVGALGKMIGLDAFRFLLGHSPGDITGAGEGLALGAGVGLGCWLASRGGSLAKGICAAGLAGAASGLLVSLLGGRLMGGSLDLLARSFPDSQLRLDRIGGLLGEPGFGPVARAVTGSFEGAVFGVCIVGAMLLARQGLDRSER